VSVSRDGTVDSDDQTDIDVTGDLVTGGIPVILRRLGDAVITSGEQDAVHNQYRVLTEPLA
jgi:hypothetical protein